MSILFEHVSKKDLRGACERFRKEEDGSVIVLTLFLLVLMLILGGMAVDFMRFESRRAVLQGLADRAVLAATDLDQQLDPTAIVTDYFTKAGMASYLDGAPIVSDPAITEYREVTVNAKVELDTFFLRLIGTETLTARATSTAVEGLGNIEVSLVLDVSGSMHEEIPLEAGETGPTETRIERLRTAATSFVTTLLTDTTRDRVSLSLVPYSEHVNVGPEIFNRMNVNSTHGFSHCIELPDTSYSTTTIDYSTPLEQAQHFQSNGAYDVDGDGILDEFADTSGGFTHLPDMNQPVCPQQDFEQIVPISQDVATLTGNIAQLHPRSGTSIFMGLKWAVYLLDPDFNDIYTDLPNAMQDTAFGSRPVAYETSGSSSSGLTQKYVVLMSDGQNDNSNRIEDYLYETPSLRAQFAYANYPYVRSRPMAFRSFWDFLYTKYTAEQGDTLLNNMCTEAKSSDHNIIIYAIAMGTDPDPVEDARGKAALSGCSSGPGFYYETSGAELVAIFDAIANQITDLRLTQ